MNKISNITDERIKKNFGYEILSDEELNKAVKGGYQLQMDTNNVGGIDENFNRKENIAAHEKVCRNIAAAREMAKKLNI